MDRARRYGAAALFVLLTSCAHHEANAPAESAVSTTTTTGARMLMNDDAAMRLAKARCAHERACGRAEDPDSCTRATYPQVWGVLRDERCPAGVDEARLTTCLAYVRNQACDAGGLNELESCRGDTLCAAPAR